MKSALRQSCWIIVSVLAYLYCGTLVFGEELTSTNFATYRETKGVILVSVDWGRKWGCGQYDNAQLLKLKFEILSGDMNSENDAYSEILLQAPAKLLAKPEYLHYGFVVNPGEYALTEYSVQAAKPTGRIFGPKFDVGFFNAEKQDLIKDGVPQGGTFKIQAGEIVYIGHFGLDCYKDPIPWRYYEKRGDAFKGYTDFLIENGFGFLKNEQITYRLFETSYFGKEEGIQAEEAEKNKELILAQQTYYRNYLNSQKRRLGPAAEASDLYEWARVTGYIGKWAEAEKGFNDVLSLIDQARGRADNLRVPTLCELARLLHDTNQDAKAIPVYEQAVALLENVGIRKADPIAYAVFLEDYSESLRRAGFETRADEIANEASTIRRKNKGVKAQFEARRYSTKTTHQEINR